MLQTPRKNSREGTIWDHIAELRSRLILCLAVVAVGMVVSQIYYPSIFRFLLKFAGQHKLVFLSILDPLVFIFKIDLAGGIILASPFIGWMIFLFIKPALSEATWARITGLYASSLILAVLGLFYAYFLVIPTSFTFLLGITIPGIQSTITADSYFGFMLMQLLISALIFQIPLFMVIGTHMNVFRASMVASKRRYIYAAALIVLSIVTPTTDIFSLATVFVPTMIIFEGGLLASRFFDKRKPKPL